MYDIDENGKWKVDGVVRTLIEPSESYLTKRKAEIEQEEQRRLEQELLDSLIPSKEEILLAEAEIQTINILMEVGLI